MAQSYKDKLFAANSLVLQLSKENERLKERVKELGDDLQEEMAISRERLKRCQVSERNCQEVLSTAVRLAEKYEPETNIYDLVLPS